MYDTHTPAEWAGFLSLGVGFWAACAALLYLICDAEPADFDLRPLLLTAWDRLLVEIVRARRTVRDSALAVAALVFLLTAPIGATR
ncbi:hypothetical protein [Streptomyces kaempferi]|uniref:Uncharacterized protein n=1 Tax=Streptomyces kaempferi TaxID=333725 RepID=A0ABW3XUV2_9ACTN